MNDDSDESAEKGDVTGSERGESENRESGGDIGVDETVELINASVYWQLSTFKT